MPHGLVLLARRQMALIIFRTTKARIEQKLCQRDVGITAVIALNIVDKSPETNQCLLHLLMPIKPCLLARAKMRYPAIGQPLCGFVQAQIAAIGQRVMIDGRLNEVARNVALVIAAMIGRPALGPLLAISQCISRLQISV